MRIHRATLVPTFEELNAFMLKVEKLRKEGLTDRIIGERLSVARTTIVDRRRRWARMKAEREMNAAALLENEAEIIAAFRDANL